VYIARPFVFECNLLSGTLIHWIAERLDPRIIVAWNLMRIRFGRGLSQERLAFEAEIDRPHVGALERLEEKPTVNVLDRLAGTLAVLIWKFSGRGEGRFCRSL
jgi:hypothetical protein